MFASKFVVAFSLAAVVFAAPSAAPVPEPVSEAKNLEARTSSGFSLNNFGGFDQLSNFDSFFGSNNFGGLSNSINFLDSSLSCSNVGIDIVQQQLAIMAEFTKQLLLEQVCEVEIQMLLFSQFLTGLNGFGNNLLRFSNFGSQFGFDQVIASKISDLFVNGQIVSNDFGFSGSSIGSNSIFVSGSNWVDSTSPLSVVQALSGAQRAALGSGQFFSGF